MQSAPQERAALLEYYALVAADDAPPATEYEAALAAGKTRDPIAWLSGHSPKLGLVARERGWQAAHRMPYPLRSPECEANAILNALELFEPAGQLSAAVTGFGPIPLFMFGPAIVFGHFDPRKATCNGIPGYLQRSVWMSVDDYLKARDDLLAQLDTLGASTARRVALQSFDDFKRDAELGDLVNGAELRAKADWLRSLPTVSENDRARLDEAASQPEETIAIGNFPEEFALYLTEPDAVLPDYLLPDPSVSRKLPPATLSSQSILPFAESEKAIFALVGRRGDSLGSDTIRNTFHKSVIVISAPQQSITRLIDEDKNSASKTQKSDQPKAAAFVIDPKWIKIDSRAADTFTPSQLQDGENLLKYLITHAVRSRASDIHIDIEGAETRCRVRVDGSLRVIRRAPQTMAKHIRAIIRNWSQGQLNETPEPYDARLSLNFDGRPIDVRIAVWFAKLDIERPVIVLRILDKNQGVRSLSDLGMSIEDLQLLRRYFKSPQGMILVAGPTGSGKSTTLFAGLREINRPEEATYTLEDPIEYEIEGVNQILVASDPKMKEGTKVVRAFSDGIRTLMRMDPDNVLVGEIRDQETAKAAMELAQTGHLVVSTVHGNDPWAALQRLLQKGLDPADLGEALRLMVAQRLVPKLCSCRRSRRARPDEIEWLRKHLGADSVGDGIRLSTKHGCVKCRHSGYSGRVAVLELLEIRDALRDELIMGSNLTRLRSIAKQAGHRSLIVSGARKVLLGVTTIERVLETIEDRD